MLCHRSRVIRKALNSEKKLLEDIDQTGEDQNVNRLKGFGLSRQMTYFSAKAQKWQKVDRTDQQEPKSHVTTIVNTKYQMATQTFIL